MSRQKLQSKAKRITQSWVSKLQPNSSEFPHIHPTSDIYVVGDIHGRLDLLKLLLSKLDHDLPIVCVGDYVDRGEDSKDVLQFLHGHPEILCLLGNHEDMLLSFLENPTVEGSRWLRHGGLQTLASFGVSGIRANAGKKDLLNARDILERALGTQLISWLRTLPHWHQTGNVLVVHAGADPELPASEQQADHLIWGHSQFLSKARKDGLWVVHGHTIVDAPMVADGRIAIDTGAYATGRLTAVRIGNEQVSFVTT